MDDEIPTSDDLLAIGFEFSDADCMYQYVGSNKTGPQVVVTLHDNSRRDDYMMAKSLSLYWTGSFGIRDNPTLGQIKTLLAALKGE